MMFWLLTGVGRVAIECVPYSPHRPNTFPASRKIQEPLFNYPPWWIKRFASSKSIAAVFQCRGRVEGLVVWDISHNSAKPLIPTPHLERV